MTEMLKKTTSRFYDKENTILYLRKTANILEDAEEIEIEKCAIDVYHEFRETFCESNDLTIHASVKVPTGRKYCTLYLNFTMIDKLESEKPKNTNEWIDFNVKYPPAGSTIIVKSDDKIYNNLVTFGYGWKAFYQHSFPDTGCKIKIDNKITQLFTHWKQV